MLPQMPTEVGGLRSATALRAAAELTHPTAPPLRRLCNNAFVDLVDPVHAAQAHGHEQLFLDDVDRLGDAGLAAGAEAIRISAADHARLGAERERAHHVLAGADAAVEHDLHLVADRLGDLGQHLD